MSKGLKQQVAEATVAPAQQQPALPPVKVGGDAHKALANHLRRWSGWPDAVLMLAPPPGEVSPYGSTDHNTREVHINIDRLSRNPNRVLFSVTPFRLRQEAIMTGVMLHEAAHARYSHWRPRTAEAAKTFVHGEGWSHAGQPVTVPTIKFATLIEEARIEGLMARDEAANGAHGLSWTMRAAGAQISPMTALAADPDQQLMDLITSWVLRAGKQEAVAGFTANYGVPRWVVDFGRLLYEELTQHFVNQQGQNPNLQANKVMSLIRQMLASENHTGTFMVDCARSVLDMLFPETPPDDAPAPGDGCGCAETGEATVAPAGEGEGDGDEAGEGDSEGEGEGDEAGDSTSALAQALAALEQQAQRAQAKQAQEESEAAPPPPEDEQASGNGAGAGQFAAGTSADYRAPTAAEREIRRGADKFLRDMIDPSVTTKIRVSSSPSSSIDAASYSAWKAAGQTSAPQFFRQTKRVVTSSPPVRVAILVDRSMSMDSLVHPSALLSWALSSAAFDLRNFAGHGVQVESCLIHWGSRAEVIQKNGQMLRGIYKHGCREYTDALSDAFDLVEEEMPGFLGVQEKPSHRLLVHFTDWALGYSRKAEAVRTQVSALMNGVNTLSVVPEDYSVRHSSLVQVMDASRGRTGKAALLKYDPRHPDQVWTKATELLA